MNNLDIIDAMLVAGCSAGQVRAVIAAMQKKRDDQNEKARLRMQRLRERRRQANLLKEKETGYGEHSEHSVTPPSLLPPPSSSPPHPPNNYPPLHPTPPAPRARANAGWPAMPDASPAAAAAPDGFLEIIRAFDDARCEVWGEHQRRLAPGPTDRLTAQEWLKSGLSPDICQRHFREEMAKMADRDKPPPRVLKFFDASLKAAAAQEKTPPQSVMDAETSKWQARLDGFRKRQFWLDSWGEPPTSPKCQCPKNLLAA